VKPLLLASCVLLFLLSSGAPLVADDGDRTPSRDAFARAQQRMQLADEQLGYRPKAHWPRYPHPKTVPYVLPFFEDLLAHPLDTYMFTRTLGNAVEDLLTPERLAQAPKDPKRGQESLYKLGVMLATERRIGGFRVFGIDTARLGTKTHEGNPFGMALGALGTVPSESPPSSQSRGRLPAALHRPLAVLILQLVEARTWIDRGLRHVTPAQRKAVFATLPNLVASTPDGEEYFPVLDDVAKVLDEHSLHFGCLKALQAVQNARRALGAVEVPEGGWPAFELRRRTRFGTLLIDNNGVNTQQCDDPFLIVRFGADNSLDGPVGATGPERPLSVALLMGGTQRVGASYGLDVQDERCGRAHVASGILGCGIVYMAGEEDNYYKAGDWGLGAGLFGLGALVDEGGNDHYKMASMGQGAAFFGAGLLLDAAGDDRYHLAEGDGQGFGGPGGIGILADRSGDDHYYAEADATKAGRADYHSKDRIAVSNAQGVGSGRRGDISDGHVWAGGLGALLDVDGDDVYEAGNFSQGLGYWYGTGLLWDGGGDDRYRSVYFTQGSGAHFAIGALIDESGNDRHELWDTAGAALAFGWDVVNAFLIDRGDGNDYYEADRISMGVAEVRSNAYFIDEGGDDTYVARAKGKFLGDVDTRASYDTPGRTADFPWRIPQVAVFLDLAGKDTYLARAQDGSTTPHPRARDGTEWNVRTYDLEAILGKALEEGQPPQRGAPNHSFAADLPDDARAFVGFLQPWPARKPVGNEPAGKTPVGAKPATKAAPK